MFSDIFGLCLYWVSIVRAVNKKKLFVTTITKPPEVIVYKFFVSVSVSFSCSKGQEVRAYLDIILN